MKATILTFLITPALTGLSYSLQLLIREIFDKGLPGDIFTPILISILFSYIGLIHPLSAICWFVFCALYSFLFIKINTSDKAYRLRLSLSTLASVVIGLTVYTPYFLILKYDISGLHRVAIPTCIILAVITTSILKPYNKGKQGNAKNT